LRHLTLRQVAIIVVAILLLFIAPRFLKITHLRLLNEIAYFSLFAISFNLLFGYAGLLSFGHAAYFGLGAYTTAILLKRVAGTPLLLSILSGGIVGAIVGAMVGFFCVRRKGGYFVLLTLAFNQLIWAVAWKWRNVTGGDDGLGGFVPKTLSLGIIRLDMTRTETMYYLTVTIVLILLFLAWYLTKTPFGNTIWAIKVNEERAAFLGYNVKLSRILIFTVASFFAGIAGSLFAVFQDFVATNVVNLLLSTEVILMTILGGTGSFFGPILGSAVFVYFSDWLSSLTDRWEFFMGVLFIIVVLYFHQGAIGLIPKRLKSFFKN
jgi:branched-chain amino acid transport system permease protein